MSSVSWKIDPVHSSIHFSVRHLVVAKVRGQFRKWSAEVTLDEADLTKSSVALTVDVESIDTGNGDRDASLRSPMFFEVEKFPSLAFRSRRIERAGETNYRIVGDLTIRGVTKEVALDAELGGFILDHKGARRAGFSVHGSVVRSEFGITWNQALDAGGVFISDLVDFHVEIEAVAPVAQAA